mmetsp:Transcript_25799/g.67390  ORF Transcript_25799/g.67390 Transcript_25799/m.67390 type:complete len:240 (+) Transcript_25799:524-1243(+)
MQLPRSYGAFVQLTTWDSGLRTMATRTTLWPFLSRASSSRCSCRGGLCFQKKHWPLFSSGQTLPMARSPRLARISAQSRLVPLSNMPAICSEVGRAPPPLPAASSSVALSGPAGAAAGPPPSAGETFAALCRRSWYAACGTESSPLHRSSTARSASTEAPPCSSPGSAVPSGPGLETSAALCSSCAPTAVASSSGAPHARSCATAARADSEASRRARARPISHAGARIRALCRRACMEG